MTRYSERERDWPYLRWIKARPCRLRDQGGCSGVVEAAHAGDVGVRALSHRSGGDRDCIPLCSEHHRQRDNRCGHFDGWTVLELRAWSEDAIAAELARWQAERDGADACPW